MEKEEAERMVLEAVREAYRMCLDTLMVRKQTSNKKKTFVCLLAELKREKQSVENNIIQLYKEYVSGSYSKEEYLTLRKSNQNLLGNWRKGFLVWQSRKVSCNQRKERKIFEGWWFAGGMRRKCVVEDG